jgi:hypothetical protein
MKISIQTLSMILVLSFAIASCQSAIKETDKQLKIFDLTELPEPTSVKLSDLGFEDIEYIPLETNEECVIPIIGNILVGKDYFLTHFYTKIFMFRADGSFVTRIGTEGRGPNEFTVVHDVDIDDRNQRIYLVDGWQQRFYVYSERGQILRTFKSPLYAAAGFRFTKDGILCYNMNQFANIANSYDLFDTTGIIIKEFPNKYPWVKAQGAGTYIFSHENIFYRFNNKLFKKEVYSDTVYVYENLEFKPHLVIEHGKRLITPKARSESTPEYIRDNFITPLNLFEFGDYIYYEFFCTRNGQIEGLSYIGSKKTNYQLVFDPEKGLINDIDGGPNVWPKTIKDDNTLIAWVEALKLKIYVASEAFKKSNPKYPDKKKELERLANNLKETDNPILMMVKFKN